MSQHSRKPMDAKKNTAFQENTLIKYYPMSDKWPDISHDTFKGIILRLLCDRTDKNELVKRKMEK